jgi:hypothetical protein
MSVVSAKHHDNADSAGENFRLAHGSRGLARIVAARAQMEMFRSFVEAPRPLDEQRCASLNSQ